MPACVKCDRFDSEHEMCDVVGGSPIRKCVVAILETECPSYKGRVLEIGCGGWGFAKQLCELGGAEWHGIDPLLLDTQGRPTIATKQGSASSIPYPDEYFDVVLGSQTLEHWEEYGTDFFEGLEEIYRVLKVGGLLSLNFPIHFHGHPIFVAGDLKVIRSLFLPSRWKIERFEPWRKEPAPLPNYLGWRGNEYVDAAVGDDATSWIAQLHAIKIAGPRELSPPDRQLIQNVRRHLKGVIAPRDEHGYAERLLPGTQKWKEKLPEHFARYMFVAREAIGKRVLDVGCGVGYGARRLAKKGAAEVIGIDYSDQALTIARQTFGHERVQFRIDDAERLRDVQGPFDVIVIFDVLERLYNPDRMFQRCMQLLTPDGVLFCSTPNASLSTKREDGTTPQNPYHIREYSLDEFQLILSSWFLRVDVFGQDYAANYRRMVAAMTRIREETRRRDYELWRNPAMRFGRLVQRILKHPAQWNEDPDDVFLPQESDISISEEHVTQCPVFVARCCLPRMSSVSD